MSKYKILVIHCSATPEGMDIDGEWIKRVHMQNFGWDRPGYSHFFHLSGFREVLREHDQDGNIDWDELTYGAGYVNGIARHVCYAGGLAKDGKTAKDTRTEAQKKALEAFVLNEVFGNPEVRVIGHNQIHARACPSFDVPSWCESIGVPEKNIYRGQFKRADL